MMAMAVYGVLIVPRRAGTVGDHGPGRPLPNALAPAASFCTGSWNHIGQVRDAINNNKRPHNKYRGLVCLGGRGRVGGKVVKK